jgi:hypothetical protein
MSEIEGSGGGASGKLWRNTVAGTTLCSPSVILSILLARREKQYRKELGL